jgi:hypothetical protein
MVPDVSTGLEFQDTTFCLHTTVKNCSFYVRHIPEFLRKAKKLSELLYAAMPSGDKFPVLGQFSAVCVLPLPTAFCRR